MRHPNMFYFSPRAGSRARCRARAGTPARADSVAHARLRHELPADSSPEPTPAPEPAARRRQSHVLQSRDRRDRQLPRHPRAITRSTTARRSRSRSPRSRFRPSSTRTRAPTSSSSIQNEGSSSRRATSRSCTSPCRPLVKVGKFKAQFGKINTLHLTCCPGWTSLCRSPTSSAADRGLERRGRLGREAHRAARRHVFRADRPGLPRRRRGRSSRRRPRRLAWLGQYRVYRDFGDDHNLELGASYGEGFNGTSADARRRPSRTSTSSTAGSRSRADPYRSFILRSEFFRSLREQPTGRQQIAHGLLRRRATISSRRRWFVGARYEFAGPRRRRHPARPRRGRDADVPAERVLACSAASSASGATPAASPPTRASCRSSSRSAPTAPIHFEVAT